MSVVWTSLVKIRSRRRLGNIDFFLILLVRIYKRVLTPPSSAPIHNATHNTTLTCSFTLSDDSGIVPLTTARLSASGLPLPFLSRNPSLVPGVCVLLRGFLREGGKEGSEFEVRGIRFPYGEGEETEETFEEEPSSGSADKALTGNEGEGDEKRYILLVSDIFVGGSIPVPPRRRTAESGGSDDATTDDAMEVDKSEEEQPNDHDDKHQLRLALLREWISGNLPQSAPGINPKNVVRMVVAGGGVPPPISGIASKGSDDASSQTLRAVKSLDLYLSMVASSLPVTLMPSGPPATPHSYEPPKGFVGEGLGSNGKRDKNTPLPTVPPPLTNSLLPQVREISIY